MDLFDEKLDEISFRANKVLSRFFGSIQEGENDAYLAIESYIEDSIDDFRDNRPKSEMVGRGGQVKLFCQKIDDFRQIVRPLRVELIGEGYNLSIGELLAFFSRMRVSDAVSIRMESAEGDSTRPRITAFNLGVILAEAMEAVCYAERIYFAKIRKDGEEEDKQRRFELFYDNDGKEKARLAAYEEYYGKIPFFVNLASLYIDSKYEKMRINSELRSNGQRAISESQETILGDILPSLQESSADHRNLDEVVDVRSYLKYSSLIERNLSHWEMLAKEDGIDVKQYAKMEIERGAFFKLSSKPKKGKSESKKK